MPRLRLIRSKLTAALALSGLLQRINNQVIQLQLEQDLDGIIQLMADVISVSFQLQTDPDQLDKLGQLMTRLDRMVMEVHLDHTGLTMWEHMYRLGKLDEVRAQVRQAKALVMAYMVLPEQPERRPVRPRSAHPPEVVVSGGRQEGALANPL